MRFTTMTRCPSRTAGLLLTAVLAVCGCSRGFYRQQADEDAKRLVAEKSAMLQSDLQQFGIAPDPRSRMFDGNDPDHPPMPPDDPVAHQLIHCIDCKKGYPHWHADGDTPYVENPDWIVHLPWNDKGEVEVDTDSAVRIALMHSSDYQQQLEELYLSALDVSFERFRFDTQFFGGYQVDYIADGPLRNSSFPNSSSILTAGTTPGGIRAQKLFATGGEMVVSLANSLVWQFSGPDTYSATTLLDFTLVQPLLRGAGRDVVLERLTISERALLANVRALERYQREYYLNIVTGRNPSGGVNRRGGVFGGAGLSGFTGVGGGGFGRVGANAGISGGGGAGGGQAGGFFGLMQSQQDIRNQEGNIASLRSSLAQLESLFQAGRIDFFQVELARQALYNAQSRLLNARAEYQAQLDGFKIDLGLPPQLEMKIRDDLITQFDLIDEAVVPVQNEVTNIQQELGGAILQQIDGQLANGEIQWDDRLRPTLELIHTRLARLEALREQVIRQNVSRTAADIERLKTALPERLNDLEEVRAKLETALANDDGEAQVQLDRDVIDTDRIRRMPASLEASLQEITRRLEAFGQPIAEAQRQIATLLEDGDQLNQQELADRLREQVLSPVPNLLTVFSADVLELVLIQARARTETVMLSPIDLTAETAFEVARENRRDWRNARLALVDAWRLIQFNANDLESDLDVVFSGDLTNVGDHPFDLRGEAGRLRVGLQFDAPITRLAERNTYRQALIEYQQAKRSYYTFRDQVSRGLRGTLRTIDVNRLNFELRRAAVHVAIAQVELARLRLQEPPQPGVQQEFSSTTARDLVQALNDLLTVQNDFLSVWISYEALRRTLDLDLGTMQLDSEGLWIDPGPITAEKLQAEYAPLLGMPQRLPTGDCEPLLKTIEGDGVLLQPAAPRAFGGGEPIETPPRQQPLPQPEPANERPTDAPPADEPPTDAPLGDEDVLLLPART